MNFEQIKYSMLEVYLRCNVKSFPIDCFKLLDEYKLKCNTYISQSPKKKEKCFKISDDAFTTKNVVFYNDEMPIGRVRFSLMHELAHRVLKHTEPMCEEQEKEADFFASHTLAPRMAIHYARCKNQNDVAKVFRISQEAAQYAFDDYRRWYRWTVYHKMNAFDKAMYAHFYNKQAKCFVYSLMKCAYCDTEMYNSPDIVCRKCRISSRAYMQYQSPDEDLLIAESQWLYGKL